MRPVPQYVLGEGWGGGVGLGKKDKDAMPRQDADWAAADESPKRTRRVAMLTPLLGCCGAAADARAGRCSATSTVASLAHTVSTHPPVTR